MEKTIQYRSQTITVRAIKKSSVPVSYEPQIVITAAVQILNAYGEYPPKRFLKPEEAIEYGEKAAKWIIDHPAVSGGLRRKKKKEEDKKS